MTESEFRTAMLENGWTEKDIEDDIDAYNDMKSSGLTPISYEDTLKMRGTVDNYPCE